MSLRISVLLAVGMLSTPFTRAAMLTETVGTSFSANTTVLPAFDPSLGTLDSVDITITGDLTLFIQTTPNLLPFPPTPLPYPYTADVWPQYAGQLFQSLGATFGPLTSVLGAADGSGDVSIVEVPLVDSFNFDALSNLSGLDEEGTARGKLSSFVSPIAGSSLPLLEEMNPPTFIQTSGQPVFLETSVLNGTLLAQYTYTATMAPVPLPSSLTLFGLGLVGVSLLQRRSRGHASHPC